MLLSATRLNHAHTETIKALLQNRKTLGNSFTDDLLSQPIQPYYRPQIAAHCWNKYSHTSHVGGRYPAGNVNPSVSGVGRVAPVTPSGPRRSCFGAGPAVKRSLRAPKGTVATGSLQALKVPKVSVI